MSGHIFVDETKRAGYVIAVTVSDTEAIRKTCVLWCCQVSGGST